MGRSVVLGWTIQIVRWHTEPETRWFHRHVLRRRMRHVEEILFAAPAPKGMKLEKRINAPSRLTFEGPITDFSDLWWSQPEADPLKDIQEVAQAHFDSWGKR